MTDLLTAIALDIYWHDHCELQVIAARSSYKHVIEHLKKHFGHLATNVISTVDVREYCNKRRAGKIGKQASDGTLHRELTMLLTAIRFAAKKLRLKNDDIVPDIISAFPRRPTGKKIWLTLEEMDHMLNLSRSNDSRVYRFCMIGFYCGQRKEAILELQPKKQINLKTGLIDFNPPGRVQTKKQRPIVPIADDLMPLAEEIVQRDDDYWCIHPGSIRSNFEALVEKCKFDKHVTPHVLRHTYATQALQNGISIWDVAGVLGDDPKTVQEHYGHHCPGYLKDAVNFRRK